jgi:hypothetical protein
MLMSGRRWVLEECYQGREGKRRILCPSWNVRAFPVPAIPLSSMFPCFTIPLTFSVAHVVPAPS